MFANIAKSLFVIPASSIESEHHFSIAGQIVTEQRSLLDPDTVEALVVLKEASINNMWPASVTGSKKLLLWIKNQFIYIYLSFLFVCL